MFQGVLSLFAGPIVHVIKAQSATTDTKMWRIQTGFRPDRPPPPGSPLPKHMEVDNPRFGEAAVFHPNRGKGVSLGRLRHPLEDPIYTSV